MGQVRIIDKETVDLAAGQYIIVDSAADGAGKLELKRLMDGKAGTETATPTKAGLMSASDKSKLDGVAPNATANAAGSAAPLMDGTATPGSSADYARSDHRHPTDTPRAPLASPALTGVPTAPTAEAGTDTDQLATTAFVQAAVGAVAIPDDGRYPKMSVGGADSLLGETAETATFAERTSAHAGIAEIESIHGNTVVFNQHGRLAKYTDVGGIDGFGGAFAPFTVAADGRSAALQNAALPNLNYICGNLSGHKILVKFALDVTGTFSKPFVLNYAGNIVSTSVLATGENKISGIGTMKGTGGGSTYNEFYFYPNGTRTEEAVTCDYTLKDFQLFDLTQMFGAGNEPATVAEFEAMFPEEYYPYNAGELLNVNIDGVNDREIPVATYFPDGMKSAGIVYDELTADNTVKRVGSVDLGTLTWIYHADSAPYFSSENVPDMKRSASGLVKSNIMCALYETVTSGTSGNNQIAVSASRPSIFIQDHRYTDTATFKAAMSGVMAVYELATPIETLISPALNLAYRVEQGGTEQIIIPEGGQSAAPTMAICYGYTAEGLRDEAMSIVAPVEGATASANHAAGTYLVHGGKLYKATTAIAAGEAIAPGTNCTQTTVMAELLALTS